MLISSQVLHKLTGNLRINSSGFVVTFDNGLSANIHRHRWKERLKTSKLAESDNDMSETSKDNRGVVPQR